MYLFIKSLNKAYFIIIIILIVKHLNYWVCPHLHRRVFAHVFCAFRAGNSKRTALEHAYYYYIVIFPNPLLFIYISSVT